MEVSGPQWCERFSTSTSVDDLTPDFAGKVNSFLRALWAADATTLISATYRPPERTYLMHWTWQIVHGDKHGVKTFPKDVPSMPGVEIDWTHDDDLIAAEAAAKAMVETYGLVHLPVLNSRHTERRAIDMTIEWDGPLAIKSASGATVIISGAGPRDGTNPLLWPVSASYGVIKLPSDPPHWSVDGH